MNEPLYIGIMSGTSADGIDAVLISGSPELRIIASHSHAMPDSLRAKIHAICLPSNNEIDRLGSLDVELGELFADAACSLLRKVNLPATAVSAIGSHGQTIRHRPALAGQTRNQMGERPFTLQIGDPNIIAEKTGITTVADFRRRDIAAGGQGAPLVPGFHRALFYRDHCNRAIVNIGGMANITWLPAQGDALGFDTGPGNVLMDSWILSKCSQRYDKNGAWAATGKVSEQLLDTLLMHSFLQLPPPKSTGREEFNLEWLESVLTDFSTLPNEDVQATLVRFTAHSIADAIVALNDQCLSHQDTLEVIVCGGGAYNTQLLTALARACPYAKVMTTQDLGVAPEWIEAMAFAWLAEQTIQHLPGNLKKVTGATRDVILGGVYFA
jgi:anhydro-N-acetylmuramic acid kinase